MGVLEGIQRLDQDERNALAATVITHGPVVIEMLRRITSDGEDATGELGREGAFLQYQDTKSSPGFYRFEIAREAFELPGMQIPDLCCIANELWGCRVYILKQLMRLVRAQLLLNA